jgi:hypothetical protein
MSQAHALCKEKRGHTTSIHPADSIAQKGPRRTKLLAAGLYFQARGEERLGSTNAPRLKYGEWMATPPTPVSASLRSQNGWRLEGPSHLESKRPGPNARRYAGQETHTRTACDSSPYRRATECHRIRVPTPQPSGPPYSPGAALVPRRTKKNEQIIKEPNPPIFGNYRCEGIGRQKEKENEPHAPKVMDTGRLGSCREANRNCRGMRENERRNEDGSRRTMERTHLMPVAFEMQKSQHKWQRGQSVRVWVGSFEDGRRRTGVSAR